MSIEFSKRYWLIAWDDYNKMGGLRDVQNTTDDLFEASEWLSEWDVFHIWDNQKYCYLDQANNESKLNERFELLEEKIEAVMDAFNAVSGVQLTTLIDSLDAKINDIKIRAHTLGEKLAQLGTKIDMIGNAVYNQEKFNENPPKST